MTQTNYSPKTAAGRKSITNLVRSLAESHYGADVEVQDQWPSAPSRTAYARVTLGDATVGITIGPDDAKHGYCLPWNIRHGRDATFSGAFGVSVGAEVNRFHRRKCMGFSGPASGSLLQKLDDALRCIADGHAFEPKEN